MVCVKDKRTRKMFKTPLGNKIKDNAQSRYDASNTVQIKMKLNRKTDADILARLDAVGNKQGYIKRLIRADMERAD